MDSRSSGPLWAITSYFNPGRSPRRRLNYATFRARLRAPLVTVELGYGEYDLDPADAEVLVKLPGRDRLWQKERLLDRAMAELPSECQGVVWLDCDVALLDDGWPELTLKALERWPVVQPFSTCRQIALSDGYDLEAPFERVPGTSRSLASRMLDGSVPPSIFSSIGSSRRYAYEPGFAWAARRDVIEDIGLYDALVLGCGDKAMASAAYGRFDGTADAFRMSRPHASHYRRWARSFHRRISGRVGCVDGPLAHFWHGDTNRRARRAPYTAFRRFVFDPKTDLAIDDRGAWQWASDKPELHRYVADSLRNRCLDCDDAPPLELLERTTR
ncbi:MAG: hypothetical protein P8Y10_13300 [Gemmatimonadales bacterium]